MVKRHEVARSWIRNCLALAAVCGMTILGPISVHAQSFPMPASEAQSTNEPPTSIKPSLRVAERYDSNVFFVPGMNLEDYVTTVSPQLKLTQRNQWVEGMIGGGATGEVYAKNTRLNYVGANASMDLNLDGVMNALLPGLGLRVTDAFVYTPQPLAFADPTGGSQMGEAFAQGIQVQRVDSFTNAAKVEASYFFSPFMGVTSTYTDQRRRFGQPIAAPAEEIQIQRGFINTNLQTLTSGLVGKLTSSDTVLLSHQYQKAAFLDSERGDSGFSTQGVIVRWARSITPVFQTTVEGGFSVISSSSDVYPVGTVLLRWTEQYTTAEVSYSQTVAPSFYVESTPLLSQVVTGTVRRHIAEPLSLSLSGSYAVNESVPDGSLLHFQSYAVTPRLEYKLSRRFKAILSYTRSQFQQNFSGQSFDFDRNVVMFSLLSEWQ
jgi:hypothetical protein